MLRVAILLIFQYTIRPQFQSMLLGLSQGPQQLELRLQIPPPHLILNLSDLEGRLHCGELVAFVKVGVGEFKLLKLAELHVSIISK